MRFLRATGPHGAVRFVEAPPLFNRDHIIREGMKPKRRRRFFGHEQVW